MLRFLTAGESHGKNLTVIVEGIPANLPLTEEYIERHMARRQVGYGRGGRMQIEKDRAEILSGVRHGLTLGSPISMLIVNRDFLTGKGPDGVPWIDEMNVAHSDIPFEPITNIRPGHADTPGIVKYMQADARNILERSSARESAARVAAGALAQRFLEEFGIEVHGHVLCIGGVHAKPSESVDWNMLEDTPYHRENPGGSKMAAVRCADPSAAARMIDEIDAAREAGDSVGGILEVRATGAPIGLGSHIQWDRKLTTKLAGAVMSMNAVKGVEFGAGFTQADLRGSQVHDVVKPLDEWERAADERWVRPWPRRTNNSGGLEGGMTTGEPLVVRAIVKPIATLMSGLETVDLTTGGLVDRAHFERSDITFVPTCAIIGEAMVALVLAEAMLEKFGGDHIDETRRNWSAYITSTGPRGL
ncbi:chorismate synthase [SAR202 cluster bacterium AC-647-N09_OGT_505m]|nr:chorismate synthase [SAR202 cluster bacterium AC-647-N09_OGT_505m]